MLAHARAASSGAGADSPKRAFRSLKTLDLHIRPIHHRKADCVGAHVLLCMLAYYVEWHIRRALAPILSLPTRNTPSTC